MKKIKYTLISLAIAIGLKTCWVKDNPTFSLKGISYLRTMSPIRF
ncbi:hypothetical protein [Runella slithyformis]|uniref:Uncharacterized protein n=1 Tax=Runella slithyformis (strain ATCC 29530 / DSM 19594 / LMG 11500 / NCIMB 11436 / LSU 4) TaxID=761193 RepID=A0A7U3ZNE6_RUNSL|nr:hypothetical protein [Runella slithyformis]AEI50372.1 hypothetical protein Runsl_4019 [Runella slithyformis DSM 19594]